MDFKKNQESNPKNQINNNNKLQQYKVSTLDTMKKPKAKRFMKYCTVRKHRGQLIRCRNQSRKKSIDVKKKSKRDKVHCKNKNTKSQRYFISVFIKIITSCDIVLCQTTKNIQPLGCKLDIHLKNTFEILGFVCVCVFAHACVYTSRLGLQGASCGW